MLPNDHVKVEIKTILGTEFLENGYRKVANELKDMDYRIGKTIHTRIIVICKCQKSGLAANLHPDCHLQGNGTD